MRGYRIGVLALAAALGAGLRAAPAEEKKAEFKLSADEQTLLDLLNKARAKEKLPPLKPNPVLFKVARAHSANMAKQKKMAHELDGKKPPQRVDEAGYDYRFVAENVGVSESEGEPVPLADVHEEWMKSKAHRKNILSPKFQEVGIGLGRNKDGQVYYTQVFATPRKRR
jgi:uncharacterized protein YkwD